MRALLAVALLAALAAGQEPPAERVRPLRLDDAVVLGLAYNLGLESARLDALLERFAVHEQNAAWDVTLLGGVSAGESLAPSRSTLAGAAVVDADEANWTTGIEKPFRLGPTLGLDWRMDRTFTNSSFSTINPAYDTSFAVTLTVPLLRGRGRRAQEAELRASRAGAAAARAAHRDEAARIVEQVATAYWNLVYLQGRVRVLEKSVAVAQEIEADERRKLRPDIGRSTQLDVTQAEAETKRREVALIQGRLEARNAADDLRALVLPFTGGPDDGERLDAAERPGETATVPDLDALVAQALAARPDLQRADADLRRLEESVAQAEDAHRVQLDLRLQGAWRGVDGQFENATGDTFAGDTPSASASLDLSWPLGRRATRAALRRARMAVQQARVQRHEQVNQVVLEVRRAHRTLATRLREIEARKKEVDAARRALEGEKLRLERGTSTILDVSRLEENLTNAELSLVQARTDLESARVAVARAAGSLLARFGVRFDEDLRARGAPRGTLSGS